MDRIDTSNVVDPSILQPFTARSLKFLEDSMETQLAYALISAIGNTYSAATPYAIQGMEYVGFVNTPSSIAGGYIFYDTKIYVAEARLSAMATGSTYVLTQSQDLVADPLQFTDGVNRNVHDKFRMIPTDQALGSGTFDLNQVVYLTGTYSWTAASLLNSWSALNTPKYRRDKDNVSAHGAVTNATIANAALSIFEFPAGDRPVNDTFVTVIVLNSGSYSARRCSIDAANGEVIVDVSGLANVTTTVYLTGIKFPTS